MKKLALFLCTSYSLISIEAQTGEIKDKFVLRGMLTGQETGLITLSYLDKNEKYISDTVSLDKGKFFFSGFIKDPTLAYISGNIKSSSVDDVNTTTIFLEVAVMTAMLKINEFKHAKITGSNSQNEMDFLTKKKAPILKEMEPLRKEYKKVIERLQQNKGDENIKAKANNIREKLSPYRKRIEKIDYEFISLLSD